MLKAVKNEIDLISSVKKTNILLIPVINHNSDIVHSNCAILLITKEFIEQVKNYTEFLKSMKRKDFLSLNADFGDGIIFIPTLAEEKLGIKDLVEDFSEIIYLSEETDIEEIIDIVRKVKYDISFDLCETKFYITNEGVNFNLSVTLDSGCSLETTFLTEKNI